MVVAHIATSPAFSFDIEPWPAVIGTPLPHPGRAPDEQPGSLDLGRHVGERLLGALLLEERHIVLGRPSR